MSRDTERLVAELLRRLRAEVAALAKAIFELETLDRAAKAKEAEAE